MADPAKTTAARGGTPRFDAGALATGLYFLGIAGIYIVSGFEGNDILPLEVLFPVLLSGLGFVGLVRVISRSRRTPPA